MGILRGLDEGKMKISLDSFSSSVEHAKATQFDLGGSLDPISRQLLSRQFGESPSKNQARLDRLLIPLAARFFIEKVRLARKIQHLI